MPSSVVSTAKVVLALTSSVAAATVMVEKSPTISLEVVGAQGLTGLSFHAVTNTAVLVPGFGNNGDTAIIKDTGEEYTKVAGIWTATGANFWGTLLPQAEAFRDQAQTAATNADNDAAATAADRVAVANDTANVVILEAAASGHATSAANSATAANTSATDADAAYQAALAQAAIALTNAGLTDADRIAADNARIAAEAAAVAAQAYDPAPFNAHIANTGNPHNVTYIQVGAQRDLTLVGSIELGSGLAGDRNSYVDFHAADGADFSARVLRSPGANGSWVFTQTGTGVISFSGGSGMSYGGQLLVLNNDARLSDARAPTAHGHPFTAITGTITDAQHGNRAGGALHANAVAAGAAGFMTGADKTKLDAVGTMANRAITISTSAPSGGANGDVWLQV